MKKVLISDPIAKEAIARMEGAGFRVDVKTGLSPGELMDVIGDYDAIIIRSATKVTADIIEAGKNLKVIARGGVGLDNVDREAAEIRNIKVVNTPAATSVSVAELAIAHLLALCRFLPQSNLTMREGLWNKKQYKGIEVNGKTLGLLGFGRIGKATARIAIGLDMKVVAHDPLVTETDLDVELVSKDEVLRRADFVTLHLPKGKGEPPVIGREEFAKMKDGAILINCARGGVVDEAALIEALKSGKLRGAGIDVYEEEPTKNLELVSQPNVSVTPHIGATTVEGQNRVGIEVARLIVDLLAE